MLPYKTWKSVLWFVATWILTIGLVVSVSTSYWLIGPPDSDGVAARFGFIEDCSVSTSNDSSATTKFSCSGLRTNFQPLLLLVVMCILGVGVFSLTFLTLLTLIYCFCDQLTACGRSFHTLAGIWQATASLVTLVGVALFPVLWEEDTITNICKTSQIFELGECSPGFSLYLAVACCFLGYIVAGFSLSLDKSTFRVTRFDSMESLDTYKQSGY